MLKWSLTLLVVLGTLFASADTGGVPDRLWSRMKRGVNITRWFCYLPPDASDAYFASYFTAQDYANLDRLKIGCVRLCIAPNTIYHDGHVKAGALKAIDKAVASLVQRGKVVVWDLHDNDTLKLHESGDVEGFVTFWKEIAQHYKGKYKTDVAFELMNEPQFQSNASKWYDIQRKTVAAIRKIDPARTIVVSGTGYSNIPQMQQLPKLAESNLIYTYHSYDPFDFTHQGATWAGDYVKVLKGVPFPASPEGVQPLLSSTPQPYRQWLENYGKSRYGEKNLAELLAQAASYGKKHNVPVWLGEFGAFPPVSPPESRKNWFRSFRSAMDTNHTSWCLWGYDDIFGLGRVNEQGTIKLDPMVQTVLFGK